MTEKKLVRLTPEPLKCPECKVALTKTKKEFAPKSEFEFNLNPPAPYFIYVCPQCKTEYDYK